MLRANIWKNCGSPYVCDLCRRKLSAAPRLSPCRSSPSLSSLPISSSTPCATDLSATARSFSTSRSLQSSNKDGPSLRPGGFMGPAGASFGSFGVKQQPPSADSPAASSGLLPHELEARQRNAKLRPNPAPNTTTPPKVKRNRPAKSAAQEAQHQAKAEKSRAALAELFSQSRDRLAATENDKASSGNNPADGSSVADLPSEVDGAGQDSKAAAPLPGWGAFSQRKVSNTLQPQSTSRGAPKTSRWGASDGRKSGKAEGASRRDANRDSSTVWDDIRKATRKAGDASTGPKAVNVGTDQSFWDDLETRVAGWKSKDRVRDDFQISTTSNDISTVGDTETAPERERRKSRFELEENNSQGRSKKSKQVQKKGRRGRHGDGAWDNDWDEAEIQRWEDKQRKQEEKKRRQQQQLMQDEPSATPIFLPEFISVSSLAQALKQRTNNFRSDMEEMGFENITDDTILTGDTAALISMEYGYEPTVDNGITRDLQPRPPPEDISSVPPRPPIVTIMGHVDHGKTTLLDWLRKSSIAAQEHGGITQHIGAFVVQMSSGKRITFLDTPGHAAFLSMRQRGANVTDIVILVVAADDSVMPQTIEAIKHATAAKVPMIVAINKIDKEDAKIEQVKADLSRHGVEIEDYGGDVQVVPVSGKTGQGMDDLEENIITLSEILDVRSEPDGMAEGWVLESSVKQTGRAATVLVKRGTLRPGDVIAAGRSWARIRSLRNEAGVEVSEAPPGTPVEILGWRDLPAAGEMVLQAPDEDKAKTAVEYRQEMADRQESSVYLAEQEQRQRDKAAAEAAASAAEADGEEAEEEPAQPGILYQNYTVRADVAGSVEAVCGALQELGNQEVQPRILRSMAGQVSEYDVDHAATSKSIIINFNSPVQPHIKHRAAEAGVRIIDHSVIYHLVDEVRGTLSDLLPMTITHRVIGEADVLQIFPINIRKRVYKNIAGCKIRNGAIKRSSLVKVLRKGKVVFDGHIDTLKHVKKDVMEMGKGTECGIGFDGWEELKIDDQVQTYEIIKEKRYV